MTNDLPQAVSILLVGCGKMGGAMLGGWLDQGTDPASILVVDPHAGGLPPGVRAVASWDDLPAGLGAEVVVLAVKPQVMADVVAPYAALAKPGTVFLSIAAGKTIAFFRGLLGEHAAIVRAMPNTPSAVGRGMTVLCAGPGVGAAQRAACATLVDGIGRVAWIEDEAQMDAVTAVSGSGPAYVFHMVEALAEAGAAAGLPADLAMLLARQTVAGAGELLHQAPEEAAELRRNVTSPGGTTAAALEVLMNPDDGLPPLMRRAIDAAARRSRELAG
ncbi:pyrroline-5-carboxylate reductase [Novispirillum sp. DQ9]|uniref:pyrroline-5-carboxylate reductase n=1 Tax=Novispirillum sp. DQ9 TaxID=3398612 RepID=UPI003C7BABF7